MSILFTHSISKINKLTDEIRIAILQGKLLIGDNLLSINEASAMYGVSRDTVFKAYKELKKQGLIDSNPTKGYFVIGELHHVLLLLDTYSSFKQDLYRRFVSNLPDNYKVDIMFHQYNEKLFDTILNESIGRYNTYVVMNFSNDHFSESLKLIPPSKLLLIDLGNFEKSAYSYICQDFNEAFLHCLNEAKPLLSNYKKLVLLLPEENQHPASACDYFTQFCRSENFEGSVVRRKADRQAIESHTAYICISTEEMVRIIKEADAAQLQIGTDYGLVAYNDEAILEVVKNGITSISIDFGLMGEKAAKFVTTKQPIQEYLPTNLIQRNSLK